MIPLGICSIMALAIIIERFISLKAIEAAADRFVLRTREILKGTEPRKVDKILALCEMTSSPPARILEAGIRKKDLGRDEAKEAVQDAGSLEIPHLERYLRILGTVVTIAPLLGLLGTVVGMIRVFNVIAIQGVGDPGALAGGIREALYTTAVGLSITIPSLVFYNYFHHRTDRLIRKVEALASEFMDLLGRKET
jgi:biopolymer transport protein ExbB